MAEKHMVPSKITSHLATVNGHQDCLAQTTMNCFRGKHAQNICMNKNRIQTTQFLLLLMSSIEL